MNTIVTNPKLSKILAELKAQFEMVHGDRLLHLILYGSQARGVAEFGSDIDVLVVLKAPVNPGEEILRTGQIVADLSLQHDEVISCLFMDENRYQTRNGSLLRNIRKEGIPL
ncbi:nucleotidyltransferase domain-containing protein [Phormidesmis sp. 146-33]